jgi:methyl-accepting chemotaxis protein
VRLTVRNKLFGGFIAVVVLMVGLGLLALWQMGSINRNATFIGTKTVPSIVTIEKIRGAIKDYRGSQLQAVTASSDSELDAADALLKADAETIEKELQHYEAIAASDQDRKLFTSAKQQWTAYRDQSAAVITSARAFDMKGAIVLLNGTAKATYDSLISTTNEWTTYNAELGDRRVKSSQSSYSSSKGLVLGLVLLASLAALAIALTIARGITRGIAQLLVASRGIAEGDIDQQVDVASRDELGETAASFQTMLAYLKGMATAAETIADGDLSENVEPKSERDALGNAFRQMVANLRGIVGEVTQAAGNMSSASQQMASTSEQAGRAVDEIANAVGDVATGAQRQVRIVAQARQSTSDTGDAAEHARALAQDGVGAAEKADEAMSAVRESSGAVSSAISGLAEKSEQIGGIVATITGIAGQTNLLALNAAIEAARAGEQGRGFAVVAEEVRKLAEESKHAAATIGALIQEIQGETQKVVAVVADGAKRTEDGAATVAAARDAFEAIGRAVEEMRERIRQIVEATAEVAAVAEQTSSSTEQVSASTQQTSASTQEIAASALDLARTAEELNRVVGRFKLVP